MPKAPKTARSSQAKNTKISDPCQRTASFREALGLSTSNADIRTFNELKKALRKLVNNHYDYNLSVKEQSDATRTVFWAEAAKTMPQLYATEQVREATSMYVTRYFSNVGWLFRHRKAALQESANKNLMLEDDKDNDTEESVGVPAANYRGCLLDDQPNIAGGVSSSALQTDGSQNADDGIMLKDDKKKDAEAPANVPTRKRGRPRKNADDGVMLQEDKDEGVGVDAPMNVPTCKHGRPRKNKPGVSKAPRMNVPEEQSSPDNGMTPTSPTPLLSTLSLRCPACDPPPSYATYTEEPVRMFLRSCKPNLEHLFPVFVRIGLENKVDLQGALDWPAKERMSWLMELFQEKWGISRMNVKTLSLGFEVAEQREAMLVAAGANPRG